ncbi:hypothetical protein HA397_25520, partial [Escherichia coli]|nr:hypothetical protein [Escherichia coli]
MIAPRASHLRVGGHFGELIQGCIGPEGPVALISLPCPELGVRVSARPARGLSLLARPRLIGPSDLRRLFDLIGAPLRGRFVLHAEMPPGG